MNTKTLKLGLKIGLLSIIFLGFAACNNGSYNDNVSMKSVDVNENYEAVAEAPVYDVAEKSAGDDTKISVYGINYNVFRVMSGMGGLAYSN